MSRYVINRLLLFIPTIFGIYTLAFILMRVLPGDPASFLAGFRDDPKLLADVRNAMKLDEPITSQYVAYLGNALRGDLGVSYLTRRPVVQMIAEAFPATFVLGLSAMFIASIIGVPLGLLSAVKKDSIWDNLSRVIALLGVSIPVFWLGVQMQILFSLRLKWLPISGAGFDSHLIMPALALSGGTLALLMRMTRSTMLEQLEQDYVRTAQAKGLHTRMVLWRHALRNAMLPILTVGGNSLANLLSGALLVEVIFAYPGMGKLLVDAVNTRDYTLLQGLVIVFAVIYAGINTLVDLAYLFIDPRVRFL